MPQDDLPSRLFEVREIGVGRIHDGVILLAGCAQQVVEELLVNIAEIIVRIFQQELLDPICTDHEWVALAILLFRITFCLYEALKVGLAD